MPERAWGREGARLAIAGKGLLQVAQGRGPSGNSALWAGKGSGFSLQVDVGVCRAGQFQAVSVCRVVCVVCLVCRRHSSGLDVVFALKEGGVRLRFCDSGVIPSVLNAGTCGHSAKRALLFWRYKRAARIGLASRRFPGGPFLRRPSRLRRQLCSLGIGFCRLGFFSPASLHP